VTASLDPNWIVGFTEGEGTFCINFRTEERKINVQIGFYISQKQKELLEKIKSFFGFGSLHRHHSSESWSFRAESLKNAEKIRLFFNQYPLQGEKHRDFQLWCEVMDLVKAKKHLSREGILKIIALRNQMNPSRKGRRISDTKILKIIETRENNRSKLTWTSEEDDFLKENFRKLGGRKVAKKLGRTTNAVWERWKEVRDD